MIPVYIDEIIADCVALAQAKLLPSLQVIDENITGIHFKQGHPREIIAELKELSKAPSKKAMRYPAVWLFRDFPEDMNPVPGIYSDATVRIFIATRTDPTYNSEQRKVKSFKPILYPIYLELMNQIELSGKFVIQGHDRQQLRKTDHYFWGKQGLFDKEGNFFTDWIDCIELENLNLKTYLKRC